MTSAGESVNSWSLSSCFLPDYAAIKLARIIREKVRGDESTLRAQIVRNLSRCLRHYALLQRTNQFYERFRRIGAIGEDVDLRDVDRIISSDRTTALAVVGLCLEWSNNDIENMRKVSSLALKTCREIVFSRKDSAEIDRYTLARRACSRTGHLFGPAWQHRAFCCGTLATHCGLLDESQVEAFLRTFAATELTSVGERRHV